MFAEEIHEQPDALRRLIAQYRTAPGRAALVRAADLARASRSLTFVGMGSSLHCTLAVLPGLIRRGWAASSVEAGEALHYALPEWRPRGPLVAVSQSGESAETVRLARALAGAVPVVAITNDPSSGLAAIAETVLPICAGAEAAISTKTYTNSVGALHLLRAALDGDDVEADLESAAAGMDSALRSDLDPAVDAAAERIDRAASVHFIGRGPSLAAAFAGALILGEGARVTAVALPAGSFRHGPMELAGEGHTAVLFAPAGPGRPLIDKLRDDLLRVGSEVIVLSDKIGERSGAVEIALGATPAEAYFPLVAAIGVERMLASVAQRRGLVPGAFRYGGKVTAEE